MSLKELIILGLLFILLLIFIFLGIGSGKRYAQSQAVLANVQELAVLLNYFKQDQGRFPTQVELSDKNIILTYASVFPIPSLKIPDCNKNFEYVSNEFNNYTLTFCIPSDFGSFKIGQNKFSADTSYLIFDAN